VGVVSLKSRKSDASGDDAAAPAKAERTTITPTPGAAQPPRERVRRAKRSDRAITGEVVERSSRPAKATALPPIAGTGLLRLGFTGMIFLASATTAAGAALMTMLWLQHRDSGVLTTDVDRVWDLFEYLQMIERLVAFAIVPIALGWLVLATLNVRRATGQRRNPVAAAAAFLVGVAGMWYIGAEMVAPADGDWVDVAVGIVFQSVLVALVLLVLERLAEAAEARRRGLHLSAIVGIVYLAHLQTFGGLSNTEATDDPTKWGMLAVYLVIGALIQTVGALAASEAGRAIESGSQHRYELRHRFGESVLAQAAADRG
jgi:hypothetical protein